MAFPSTQRGWFARLFARYLLLLSLPCISCGLIYLSVRDAEATRRATDVRDGLARFAAVLEAELGRVDRAVISLAWSPRVTRFARLSAGDLGPDRYRAVEIRRDMTAVVESNPFIEDIALFFARSDVLVSTHAIVFDLASAYGPYVSMPAPDYASARRLLSGERRWKSLRSDVPLRVGEQSTTGPAYHFTIPLGGTNDLDGAVVVYLRPAELEKLARQVHGLEGASIWLTDASGATVARVGAPGAPQETPEAPARAGIRTRLYQGRSFLVTRVTAESGNVHLTTMAPETLPSSGYATRIYLLLLALTAAVAVVLAALMARSSSRPMTELARLVSGLSGGDGRGRRSELHLLASGVIRNLVEENRDLARGESERREMVADALFRQLLAGEPAEAHGSWIRRHPALAGAAFVAVVVRVSEVSRRIDRESLQRVQLLWEGIRRALSGRESIAYCGEADLNHLVIVLRLNDTARSSVTGAVDELVANLRDLPREPEGARLSFAAGRPYADPLDLSLSYEEALFAERSTGAIASLAWYDDALEPSTGFYYPIAVETRILEALRSGQEAAAMRLLERVFDENLSRGGQHLAAHPLLSSELLATLSKARHELLRRGAATDAFPAIEALAAAGETADAAAWREAVIAACRELCAVAAALKRGHNELLRDQLMHYLESHFAEELSLSRVAAHFGFSEAYLSQFIKEHTGTNYISHVEGLRLNRARELLRSSAPIPTNVLARKVGYRSSNSFRRAFRRRFGASPRDYALLSRGGPRETPRRRSPLSQGGNGA